MKTETIEEFLERGGKVEVFPYYPPRTADNFQIVWNSAYSAVGRGMNSSPVYWTLEEVALYFGE